MSVIHWLGLVTCALVIVFLFMPQSNTNGPANEQTLRTVVTALKQYQADHGRYPDKLRRVAPKYLPSIPPLRGNAKWDYHVDPNGSEFKASFVSRGGDWSGGYSSDDDSYSTDDF
jgi:type II secretory pathway pseudopilin PulG